MTQPWTTLFQINRAPLMALNLQGISQEMADRAPAPGVNSIAWILSHVVDTRRWMLKEVFHAPDPVATSKRGELAELVAAVDATQAALAAAFEAVPDWRALRPHPFLNAPAPLEEIVGTFLQHEAYHLGQLGVARKLLGLEGAIKGPA
jgi:uncharacterized damage-inducible protein DinB